MGLHAVKVLGIKITNSPKKNILEDIKKYLETPRESCTKPYIIYTPNPEQIIAARSDKHFEELLNQADVTLPDGSGLVWADPTHLRTPIPGIDFCEELVQISAKKRIPIVLIGGKENIALKTFDCLRQKYPELYGIAMEAPEFEIGSSGLSVLDHESEIMHNGKKISQNGHYSSFVIHHSGVNDYFHQVADVIKEGGCGIVFVGLGAPKQEYFIERLAASLSFRPSSRNPKNKTWIPGQAQDDKGIVFMSVGGSFDMISGKIKRVPSVMKNLRVPFFQGKIGSEFLWRLIHQPWRFSRQLALIKFVWLIMRERYINI